MNINELLLSVSKAARTYVIVDQTYQRRIVGMQEQ